LQFSGGFSSIAKEQVNDSIRANVPDVLVVKMLLFCDLISTDISKKDYLVWPDASAHLTTDEIRLGKIATDRPGGKSRVYKIKSVNPPALKDETNWETIYEGYDKGLKNPTNEYVYVTWFYSEKLGWNIAGTSLVSK